MEDESQIRPFTGIGHPPAHSNIMFNPQRQEEQDGLDSRDRTQPMAHTGMPGHYPASNISPPKRNALFDPLGDGSQIEADMQVDQTAKTDKAKKKKSKKKKKKPSHQPGQETEYTEKTEKTHEDQRYDSLRKSNKQGIIELDEGDNFQPSDDDEFDYAGDKEVKFL